MRKVYEAADLPNAYIVLNLLRNAGIAARVFNENLQGGVGEIPFFQVLPEVWVEDDRDLALAERLIARFLTELDSGRSWTCPACEEENPATFETCWQCGQGPDEGTP